MSEGLAYCDYCEGVSRVHEYKSATCCAICGLPVNDLFVSLDAFRALEKRVKELEPRSTPEPTSGAKSVAYQQMTYHCATNVCASKKRDLFMWLTFWMSPRFILVSAISLNEMTRGGPTLGVEVAFPEDLDPEVDVFREITAAVAAFEAPES